MINKLNKNNIECRPIVTGDFTQNDVMKYFDYTIHSKLKNAKYLHKNGFFVGNQQLLINKEISFLHEILKKN